MAMTFDHSLPWDELKRTDGGVPWAAIQQFADAAAAAPALLDDLLRRLDVWCKNGTVEIDGAGLCIMGILATAAERLSIDQRGKVAQLLVPILMHAARQHNDLLLDCIQPTLVSLGALAVLPAVLKAMPKNFPPSAAAYELWMLAGLADECSDEPLRAKIVALCMRALSRADAGLISIPSVVDAAMPLVKMGHKEVRPLLQRFSERTDAMGVQFYLHLLDHPAEMAEEFPEQEPIRIWLDRACNLRRRWYTEQDSDETDPEGDSDSQNNGPSGHLAQRFEKSTALSHLSNQQRENASLVALELLDAAWYDYETSPEHLDESILKKVLLEIFPQSLTHQEDFFQAAAPSTKALLAWMQSESILKDTESLQEIVMSWDAEIQARAADRSCWDVDKLDIMDSPADDLYEPISDTCTPRFIFPSDAQPETPPSYDPVPIKTTEAKIGRNDPCPCGSGKKYKKCCGRG